MHTLLTFHHRKATESGGIVNDEYITHPEAQESSFNEDEIPTVLKSNWNRNNSQHFFLSHRYNIGFYRKVKMTDAEIKAKQFAQKSAQQKREREERKTDQPMESGRKGAKVKDTQPAGRPDGAVIMGDAPEAGKKPVLADSARIKVQSQAQLDSLKHAKEAEDSIDATMKREFVPVTSFIHTVELNNHDRIYQAYDTPDDYFAKKYYEKNDEGAYIQDSIFDKTKYLSIKNTFAIALLEGFNKYMKAGLKGFISYENRNFKMPEFNADSTGYVMGKRTGHSLNVGGQLSRMQGKAFHFNLIAELGVTGMDAGSLALDFNTDVNFRLFGDTVTLAAKAYLHRIQPGTFQESYHSKFLWWDTSLDKETRTHVEGLFSYRKTNTHLRVAVTQIKNYTYFGMNYAMDSNHNRIGLTGGVYQEVQHQHPDRSADAEFPPGHSQLGKRHHFPELQQPGRAVPAEAERVQQPLPEVQDCPRAEHRTGCQCDLLHRVRRTGLPAIHRTVCRTEECRLPCQAGRLSLCRRLRQLPPEARTLLRCHEPRQFRFGQQDVFPDSPLPHEQQDTAFRRIVELL